MAYKNYKATEIIEEIGIELRKIRMEKQLTISYVANELAKSGLHISNTLLGRIENGERRIDDDTLQTICHFYNIHPANVVISASQEHIKKLQSVEGEENTVDTDEDMINQVMILYNNLNHNGQKEVSHLMRLMAYMDAFKKN